MGQITERQYMILQSYEKYFRTAVYHGYSRNPGGEAIKRMDMVYQEVSGVNLRTNQGCNTCIMRLLRDLGRLYFDYKAEKEARRKRKKAAEKEKESDSSAPVREEAAENENSRPV